MNFSSDAMADFEGLLEVNRKICKQQMAEKASPTLPTNCAVLPKVRKLPHQKPECDMDFSPRLWYHPHIPTEIGRRICAYTQSLPKIKQPD